MCSDCQVALVEKLPKAAAARVDDSGASVKLWGGIDPRTFAAIRAALDEGHIAHDDVTRGNQLSSMNSPEPMQIWIGKTDVDAARKILEGIVGHDEAAGLTPDAELARDSADHNMFGLGRTMFSRAPGEEDAVSEKEAIADAGADGGPVPDDLVENFDAEEASCEVWSGADEQMAQIFKECLQNVGIGSVVTVERGADSHSRSSCGGEAGARGDSRDCGSVSAGVVRRA